MSSAQDLSHWDASPVLYLFTSLTSGSSHIFTATSRLETILKANKIPFQAIDTATDESARRLWQRRAAGRKLPALVKEGFVVGGIDEVEDLNEFGELREAVGLQGKVGGMGYSHIVAGTAGAGLSGTAPPPNTKATTPVPGPDKDKEVDPMRELAVLAAEKGRARKGPTVGVGPDKIRPLEGVGMKEEKQAGAGAESKASETAGKSSDSVTGEVADTSPALADGTGSETVGSATGKKEDSVEAPSPAAAAAAAPDDRDDTKATGIITTATSNDESSTLPKSTGLPATVPTTATEPTSETVASTDSLAPAPSTTSAMDEGTASARKEHRGSEVMEASEAEIKEVEDGNKITEHDDEAEEEQEQEQEQETITKNVAKLDVVDKRTRDGEGSTGDAELEPVTAVEAKESVKTTAQDSKKSADGDAAGVSVED
ncbi:hypothetical protein CAC42_3840 [Sphaceloma murrayae]|uniref:Uncharacterized protein n=1 Tax=Sphaceloma murrayae TaxID=2082308 RepID=A0A2K1QPU5_9PEZI|nr:hypothetical protein CAC42_3840 [Sphaceloma murrayae]